LQEVLPLRQHKDVRNGPVRTGSVVFESLQLRGPGVIQARFFIAKDGVYAENAGAIFGGPRQT